MPSQEPCIEENSQVVERIRKEFECKCDSDRGPSIFTISDKALQKINNKNGGGGELTAKENTLSELEDRWLEKEKCVEEAHEKKWGYDKENLDELERRLYRNFESLRPCPEETEVVKCYITEGGGFKCGEIVQQYITCLENFVKKTIATAGAVSCVKVRPKTKLFSD